jgi:hypothetical protein
MWNIGKAMLSTENTTGRDLAAVRLTTIQMTKLPLQRELRKGKT